MRMLMSAPNTQTHVFYDCNLNYSGKFETNDINVTNGVVLFFLDQFIGS